MCVLAGAAFCCCLFVCTPCSSLTLPRLETLTDTFVSLGFEVTVEEQWTSLGYLSLFIVGFQVVVFLSMAHVRHILR